MSKRKRAPNAKGYSEAGGSLTRRALKGFIPNSGAPAEDIDYNNYTLRQRCRMLYMAAPLATSAINTNRTKIVGTGLTLKSTIDRDVLGLSPEAAKEWQRRTEAEFALWAEKKQNCDALATNNFASLQQLALKSWLLSGDVFAVLQRVDPTPLCPYTLRLHLVEADRISTPIEYGQVVTSGGSTEGMVPEGKPGAGNRIYDGVEVDKQGRVVAYYICNVYPRQITAEVPEWTRVLAFGARTGAPNILHIMDAERPDQYRGVPYLAPVIEPLLQLRRYTESDLQAALVQSMFTAWVKTESDPADIPFNEVGAGNVAGPDGSINLDGGALNDNLSTDDSEYEMGPGTVLHLKDGEDVVFGNPNIPTSGYETFVKTNAKIIGAGLELPYDVLIKEFNSSYSASRGALLETWETVKMRRSWFVDDFCQPVYELWLTEAVARGRIQAPGFFSDPLIHDAWCGARWIGPVQGQLDPQKEANAALTLIDRGIKTHEQVTRELSGGDWTANVEQLAQENALLRQAGNTAPAAQIEPTNKESGDDA